MELNNFEMRFWRGDIEIQETSESTLPDEAHRGLPNAASGHGERIVAQASCLHVHAGSVHHNSA